MLRLGTNRAIRGAALVAMCATAPMRSAAATGPDTVAGRWWGTASETGATTPFGLEIRARQDGSLEAFLYLGVMNFFGQALPSFKLSGDHYVGPEFGLSVKMEGDRLAGTLGGATVDLARADTLPAEPAFPPELPEGPGPRWKTPLGAAIYATPAVRGGVAYVGTAGGVLNAIRVEDGSFAWTFAAGRPIFGEVLTTEDAVYFVCDNGDLFKLDRATGKEVWRYDLGDGEVPRILPHARVFDYDHEAPTPVLADGVLFVGAGDGGLHALNDATGQRVWRVEGRGKVRVSALVIGSSVVFGTLSGELLRLDRASGKEEWLQKLDGPITSTPVLAGNRLLVGTRGSTLMGLDPGTGERLWSMPFWGSWVESTPVIADDGLGYIGSSDLRRVTCFDPRDGRVVWQSDVYGAPWGRPLVTDKFVYDGTSAIVPYMIRHTGGVVALDRVTGKLAWRYPLPNPPGTLHYGFADSPVRAGDLMVIGGMDGALYAFPIS